MIKFLDDGERDPQVGHVWNKEIQGTQQKTGYEGDKDILKNIYDLEGNNLEWTAQACDTSGRLSRGGNHYVVPDSKEFHPAGDFYNTHPSIAGSDRTSRVGLYVAL